MSSKEPLVTDEEWAEMTEGEQIEAILSSRVSAARLQRLEKEGSPAIRQACAEHMADVRKNVEQLKPHIEARVRELYEGKYQQEEQALLQLIQLIQSQQQTPQKSDSASEFCRKLESGIVSIATEAASTDEEMVVLYHSPAGEILEVDYLGFIDPDVISIIGHDSGNNSTVVLANVQTVQLIVKRIKPLDKDEKPRRRRIGFIGDVSKGIKIEGSAVFAGGTEMKAEGTVTHNPQES